MARTWHQISRENMPKRTGTPYWSFFNLWMSSMPASNFLAFWKDLKPNMAEVRNLIRR